MGSNGNTSYPIQRISKENKNKREPEIMEFTACVLCNAVIPIVEEKCDCGGGLTHACSSDKKLEVIIRGTKEIIAIKDNAVTQAKEDGSIAVYYECEKCKELRFMRLIIL